jgi:hypothetical protein
MAEVQESGPIVGQNFTDDQYLATAVAGVGIANDYTGNAFALTLPGGSDIATVGQGWAQVGAYGYTVPSGQAQDITIQPSTNAAVGRTDVITARYQKSWNDSDPGPVRIHRVEGVEGSGVRPTPDLGLNVGENTVELPLYAVTRLQGQTLDQAAVQDLRIWRGQNLRVHPQAPFYAAPLGSRLIRGGIEYWRDLVSGSPTWVGQGIWQPFVPTFNTSNITLRSARFCRIGNKVDVAVRVLMKSMGSTGDVFTCTVPVTGRSTAGWVDTLGTAGGRAGGNSGARIFTGFVVASGSGALTTVTVVATDEQFGGQWRSNQSGGVPPYPISWAADGGAEVGLRFSYEAA